MSLSCRILFWSSDGTVSSIYRVSLNGSDVRNILRTTEKIKAISLDFVDVRLYWIQHDHGNDISHIGSCDYEGGAVHLLRSSGRWVFLGCQKESLFPGRAVKESIGDFYFVASQHCNAYKCFVTVVLQRWKRKKLTVEFTADNTAT